MWSGSTSFFQMAVHLLAPMVQRAASGGLVGVGQGQVLVPGQHDGIPLGIVDQRQVQLAPPRVRSRTAL